MHSGSFIRVGLRIKVVKRRARSVRLVHHWFQSGKKFRLKAPARPAPAANTAHLNLLNVQLTHLF